jgi:acyl-CoA-binding protein
MSDRWLVLPLSLGKGSRKNTTAVIVTAAVAAVGLVSVGILVLQQRRRQTRNASQRRPIETQPPERKASVPTELWKSFENAVSRINNMDDQVVMSQGDKLMFYGLYKQIIMGNAPEQPPKNMGFLSEHYKFSSWQKMHGMPMDVAIQHYVDAVNHFTSNSIGVDDEHADDDVGGLGPAAVSVPAKIENGGYSDDNFNAGSVEAQLLRAAGENDVTALQKLLELPNCNVDYADESGQTALHLAADKNAVKAMEMLIKAGCNVNAADGDGISVLQAAVIAGHVEICRILLQAGANPDQADADGDTPRSCACDCDDGDEDMMSLFFNRAQS